MLPPRNPGEHPVKTPIAKKQFAIEASQQRVWNLLGRVIYQCLPLEKMDIVDETTFYADLRWRLAFINIPLRLRGKFVDISPPSFLGCLLSVKKGIIQRELEVTFRLNPISQDKTEVTCMAEGEETRPPLKWIVKREQQRFAENVFDSIRARLEQLC